MRVSRLCGMTAAVMATLAGGAASAGCVVGKMAELAVTMSGLQPTVRVKINGADVRMMADSGAFFSMITPGTARELKLQLQPAPYWFYLRGVGGVADASIAKVKEFTLAETPLRNVDFLVGGSEVGENLGGVLGRNVLTLADAEYDLANGAIRLLRPSGCGDHALAYWAGAKSYNPTAMLPDLNRNPAASIYVFINGVRLRATLDSGASTSVLFLSAAKRAGVAVAEAQEADKGATRGIGRRMVGGYVAPLDDIKIGDEEIKHTRIRVLETSLTDTDMLLGADFFLSHRIYIANGQRKVYFTYNGGPVFSLVSTRIDLPTEAPADAGAKAAEGTTPPKLVEGEPTDAAGFSRRGQAYAARRDFAKALPDLDRAVTLAPMEPDYLYQRAKARLSAGQMFLAMADVEQALKLRPDDPSARILRAEMRFAGHQKSEAVTDLDAIAKTASPASDLRLQLGELYQLGDRLDSAVEQYSLWIAAHPDDSRRPLALNGRCWARALLNRDLDKALADCNGAIRANAKAYGFLDSRGLVFLRMGDLTRSIADYDGSLAIRPKIAWSLYGRGLAKMKAGNADGGKADVAAALAINPNMATEAAKYGVTP